MDAAVLGELVTLKAKSDELAEEAERTRCAYEADTAYRHFKSKLVDAFPQLLAAAREAQRSREVLRRLRTELWDDEPESALGVVRAYVEGLDGGVIAPVIPHERPHEDELGEGHRSHTAWCSRAGQARRDELIAERDALAAKMNALHRRTQAAERAGRVAVGEAKSEASHWENKARKAWSHIRWRAGHWDSACAMLRGAGVPDSNTSEDGPFPLHRRIRSVVAERDALAAEVERLRARVDDATDMAIRHGGHDGSHHKAWCIDQVLRILCGDDYERVIRESCDGEDGPDTYIHDVGIAP